MVHGSTAMVAEMKSDGATSNVEERRRMYFIQLHPNGADKTNINATSYQTLRRRTKERRLVMAFNCVLEFN
jgi:hypothetical protein